MIQKTIRILHVDDEPGFTELTETFLEQDYDRFSVETTNSADKALDIITDHPPDCVVSDYNMPGMDGIEFLQEVRSEYPDIPFILFTGKGSEEVASDAISMGATDYLQKQTGSEQYKLLANRILNSVKQYRSEKQLRDTRKEYEAVFENARDALILVEVSKDRFQYQQCNPRAVELIGREKTEIVGHSPREALGPENGKKVSGAYRRCVEQRETVKYTVTLNLPVGQVTRESQVAPVSTDGKIEQLVVSFQDITERCKRTQELQQIETLFEHAQDALFLIDVGEKFTIDRVNPAWESATGVPAEQVRGQTLNEILEKPESDLVENKYRECVTSQESIAYEEALAFGEETTHWRTRIAPVIVDDVVEYLVGSTRDITDQKEREKELEEYETIIGALSDAVYVLDNDGQFTYVNDEFVELVGYEREQILGSGPSLIKNADTVERAEQQLGRLLSSSGPETVKFEAKIQPRDGDPIICEDHMGVLPYEGDSFDGSVGTLRDITDHKERKQELEARTAELEESTAELEAQYRQLFEEAPVMAVVTRTENGRPIIEDCNQLFAETLGYEKSNVIGEDLASFYTRNSREKLLNEGGYERALTGEFVRENRELVTADNETVETLLRAIPRQDITGNTSGAISLYIDISERRQLERENSRLEEFTSIVSHDLQNPLRVANGRLNLAQEECDSEHLKTIADALDRMDRIIEDLLWLAQEGSNIGSVRTVPFEKTVEETWCLISDDCEQVECHYVDCDSGDSAIIADEDRLRQLLENLFANAIEHGGEDVTVTVGATDDGIYIEDDGSGIPPEERDDVFDAGYTTAEDGTGLGLRIVEQVAAAHDWDITVTEGTTGGARFEISGMKFAEREVGQQK